MPPSTWTKHDIAYVIWGMGDRQWGNVTLHTTFLFFYFISDLFLIYFRTLASPASLAVVGFISDPPLSFIDAPGNLSPLNTCMYIVSLWTNLIFSYPYFLQVILHCLRHPGGHGTTPGGPYTYHKIIPFHSSALRRQLSWSGTVSNR